MQKLGSQMNIKFKEKNVLSEHFYKQQNKNNNNKQMKERKKEKKL